MRKIAIICFIFFLYSIPAIGSESKVGLESRAKSLGGTFLTIYDSPTGALWNPAALDLLKRPVFEINIGQPYEFDIVSISNFFPGFGTMGLSLRKWETNPFTDLLMIGWGKFISSKLSVGVSSGVFCSKSLVDPRLNFGFFYRFSEFQPTWKTLAFDNFSAGIFFNDLRLQKRDLGEDPRLSANLFYRSPADWFRIFGSCEMSKAVPVWHGGLELNMAKVVSLRVGNTDFRSPIWFWGLGMHVGDWQINLVFDRELEKLQFSTTVQFGMPLKEKAERYYQQGIVDLKEQKLRDASRNLALAHELIPQDAAYADAFCLIKQRLADREFAVRKILKEAEKLEQQSYFFSAALKYSQLLEKYPENATAVRERLIMLRPKVKYDIRRILNKGKEFFEAGNYPIAQKIFQRILLLDSQNLEAKTYLDLLEQIVQKQVEEHFYRGIGYYTQRNLAQAEKEFVAVLRLDPTHEKTQHYLKQTRVQIAELDNRVVELLENAKELEEQGDFLTALENYAEILKLDSQNQQAKEEVVRLRPKVNPDIQSLLTRAKRALAQGNYTTARRYYNQVLQIVPDHKEARVGLSSIQRERRKKSRQLLAQGKEIAAAGDWEQAVHKFRQALDYNSSSTTIRSELDSALKQVNIQSLLQQGITEYEKDNYVRAIKLFNKVLDQDPLNTEAIEYLEKTQRGKDGKIKELLQKGIQCYSADDLIQAITFFDALLELDPENQAALEYRKRAQQKQQALEKLP